MGRSDELFQLLIPAPTGMSLDVKGQQDIVNLDAWIEACAMIDVNGCTGTAETLLNHCIHQNDRIHRRRIRDIPIVVSVMIVRRTDDGEVQRYWVCAVGCGRGGVRVVVMMAAARAFLRLQ